VVGTLPLAVVCLVLLIWGNALVVRYFHTEGTSFTERVAREVDETIVLFTEAGNALAEDPAVLAALLPDAPGPEERIELDLYQRIFREIQNHLSLVEVHLTTLDGMKKFSTTEFPRRYDLTNHQAREAYLPEETSPGPVLYLTPGPGAEGSRIVFALAFRLPGGVLYLDVKNRALENPRQTRTSSELFLVNRRQILGLNLLQPQEPASFSAHPELGIIFSENFFLQPTAYQLVHRRDLGTENLSVIMITDLRTYFDTLWQILILGLALVAGTSVITVLVSIKISRSISRPMDGIIQAMTSDPLGPRPLPGSQPTPPRDELEELAFHYNRMVATIESLIQQVREEEQLLRTAERRVLESQIQPHFLYNTLGAVKSMAKLGDFEAVSTIVTDLGKILRFSLTESEVMVPLKDITEQIRRYLNIHKVRFQERLMFTLDLDPRAENLPIPKLIIQPLVENAVIHGVERSSGTVTIRVITRLEDGFLLIRVENDGPAPGRDRDFSDGFGIGLSNVEKQLQLLYGGEARFTLTREKGKTIASIRIQP
jgi:two-component system sensor histidine kinase YesM